MLPGKQAYVKAAWAQCLAMRSYGLFESSYKGAMLRMCLESSTNTGERRFKPTACKFFIDACLSHVQQAYIEVFVREGREGSFRAVFALLPRPVVLTRAGRQAAVLTR